LKPDFAAWLLLSDEFTNYAVSESQRARMPKLNRKQFFSWEAPLPTLDEQKAMINKLMLQIEKTTILNQKTEELVNTIEALPSALLRKAFRGEI
jgi:type I restriction enzyme S subunit